MRYTKGCVSRGSIGMRISGLLEDDHVAPTKGSGEAVSRMSTYLIIRIEFTLRQGVCLENTNTPYTPEIRLQTEAHVMKQNSVSSGLMEGTLSGPPEDGHVTPAKGPEEAVR